MDIDFTNIPRYDYNTRHWEKIYGPEELYKLGELLTGIPADEIPQNQKPTVKVRKYTKPKYYFPTG
jgi:hypothetical protein